MRRGVPEELAESITLHTVNLSRAAFLYALHRPELDQMYLVQMALSHDIAEHKAPDYTPHDPISKDEKHKEEIAVMNHLAAKLGKPGEEIRKYWLEYDTGKSPEARALKQLDKLDAAVMAFDYEAMGYDVSEFFPYARARLEDPLPIQCLDVLEKREYPQFRAHTKYFSLLLHEGIETLFKLEMDLRERKRQQYLNSLVVPLK